MIIIQMMACSAAFNWLFWFVSRQRGHDKGLRPGAFQEAGELPRLLQRARLPPRPEERCVTGRGDSMSRVSRCRTDCLSLCLQNSVRRVRVSTCPSPELKVQTSNSVKTVTETILCALCCFSGAFKSNKMVQHCFCNMSSSE